MADWPQGFGGTTVATVGADLTNSRGTAVTAAGSTNTKGSWVELTASSPIDADGFTVSVTTITLNGNEQLFDIAIGGAGSEQVIVENIQLSERATGVTDHMAHTYIPIPIKAGTRIAMRSQSVTASVVSYCMIHLCTGDFYSSLRCGRSHTYGADTSDSGGLVVDPGASANTKGAWVEFSSSLPSPFRYLIVCVSQRNNGNNTTQFGLLDVGVGAAGSERVLVENMPYYISNAERTSPCWPSFYVAAKAGERLAVRVQTQSNDATDRLVDVVLVAFD